VNRGADRHRGLCKQTQFDCAVHGVRSSTLFRRKRRGKMLDEVSTAIPGGAAAWNAVVTGLCKGGGTKWSQRYINPSLPPC